MPLKLIPPQAGRWSNFRVRGTHMGCYLDRSTGTPVKAIAQGIMRRWKEEIERGRIAPASGPTFAGAAMKYLDAGGENRFIPKLNDWFASTPLSAIDQEAVDEAAVALYPEATPATRNRQVFTPLIAIFKRAKVPLSLERPIGANGKARTCYLEPAEAWRLLDAAETADREIAAFLTLCLYTGLRLSEALGLTCDHVHLEESRAFHGQTKNGDPRAIHLPPEAVAALANHPRGLDRGEERVFRYFNDRRFHAAVVAIYRAAGVNPQGAPVHILRHSFATWLRRYAGADSRDLLDVGAWRDRASVERYTHTVVSEAAKMADLLPTRVRGRAKP